MTANASYMPSNAGQSQPAADWSSVFGAQAVAGSAAGDTYAGRTAVPSRRRVRISKRDLTSLTSQLAIMTRSGMDVAGALQSLVRQSRRPAIREVLENIYLDVLDGKSFSQALRRYESVFGGTYVAIVAAGEASGNMSEVLAQLAQLQRTELRRSSSIRTMMAYPLLLTSVSGMVIMGLVFFVLPTFASIFEQYDTPLPWITRMLLAMSMELRNHWWLWAPLALVTLTAAIVFLLSEPGRRCRDRVLLNAPFVRDVTRTLLAGRACRLLGMMLQSGVPLLETLGLTRAAIGNFLYQDLFSRMQTDVTNGRNLAEALLEADFVPPAASEMVATAERTGSLGSVTQLIGEHFEEEGETRMRELVTVLEPLITVGMGVVVAIIVLAVMLPMFDLTTLAEQGH